MSASSAESAKEDASASVSDGFHVLLDGVSTGIDALASLVVFLFLSFTALSLVFLLKDGPAIRAWGEHHLGRPAPGSHTRSPDAWSRPCGTISQERRWWRPSTAVVIGFAAVVLGVPLAGSIAVINFLAAYIPYVGGLDRQHLHGADRTRSGGGHAGVSTHSRS